MKVRFNAFHLEVEDEKEEEEEEEEGEVKGTVLRGNVQAKRKIVKIIGAYDPYELQFTKIRFPRKFDEELRMKLDKRNQVRTL